MGAGGADGAGDGVEAGVGAGLDSTFFGSCFCSGFFDSGFTGSAGLAFCGVGIEPRAKSSSIASMLLGSVAALFALGDSKFSFPRFLLDAISHAIRRSGFKSLMRWSLSGGENMA